MPVTVYDNLPSQKKQIIDTLTSEIDYFYGKMKEGNGTENVIMSSINFLKRYEIDFKDDLKRLRYFTHFIAIQTYENNMVLKGLLLSDSEATDIPLMKTGISNLKEGCKHLIGFRIIKNDGRIDESFIKQSLIYGIHNKVKNDFPEIHQGFDKIINDFRKTIEENSVKEIRDLFLHYQKDKGELNPFNFTETALSLDCDSIYQLLFDYLLFLRILAQYASNAMKLRC